VKELLGIPADVSVVVLLTLGYLETPGRFPGRKALEDIVCYERYQ